MEMSVSQVIKEKGKKKIYVLFSEKNQTAEGVYPDCKIIKNDGFSEDETKALELYMFSNKEQIEELAKTVSIWKAFSN